jgi:endonuclease-3
MSPPCRACCWSSTAAKVPHDRAALEALPGVGRKTANVVLNTAFGEPTIAVDTHIFRLGQPHRPGPRQGRARRRGETAQGRARRLPLHAHHWLILHGRYVCKALKPDCPNCLVADLCAYKEKTRV